MKIQDSVTKAPIPAPAEKLPFSSRPFAEPAAPEVTAAQPNAPHYSLRTISLAVQPKLTIGQPNDKYEQEADRVAETVVQRINAPQFSATGFNNPDPNTTGNGKPKLQLKPIFQRRSAIEGEATPDLESSINRARGGGQTLDGGLQRKMGQAMGADFSRVKVHTDGQADTLNRSIQARAFTTGQDVFFKKGEYNPGSRGGQELIAHELTHVVQQTGAGSLQPKIQRSQGNQVVDALDANLSFAKFKEKTYLTFNSRGKYLGTIDKWLKALDAASTWDDQQSAIIQVVDACNTWLKEHGSMKAKGEASSVTHRRAPIATILQMASRLVASNAAPVAAPSTQTSATTQTPAAASNTQGAGSQSVTAPKPQETRHVQGRVREILEASNESVSSIGGTAGDFDDSNDTEHGGSVASDYLDMTNTIGGASTMFDAQKAFRDKDAGTGDEIEAGGNFVKGAGQVGHGVTAGFKAFGGSDIKGADGKTILNGNDVAGEMGAAIGDGVATVSGTISTVKGIVDLCKDWSESTGKEKIASALDIAGNMASTGQSGVKTALGVIKTHGALAGKEVGSTALGSAAAILGIITGSIQIAQGGFSIYRSWSANNTVKEGEAKQKEMLTQISSNIQQIKDKMPAFLAAGNASDIATVQSEMIKLGATLEQLQAAQAQAAPAMSAMKKVQNRRMENGAMKAAGGTLSVVSSALVLSGVGAPIAIAIGALGGLLALGYAGLNLARNRKASKLTTIAKRLTDDGKPKAKPDLEEPGYRAMEGRIYKCYYNHLPKVIDKTIPAGMTDDEFTYVKQFAWDDKKGRVQSLDKQFIKQPAEAQLLDDGIKKNKWVEVRDSKGQVLYKEKPKGFAKLDLTFSASAHKSKQSLNTSKDELATILTQMCLQSYDQTSRKFVNSPVTPSGNADPETLKEFGMITLNTLLSAADITAARWNGWLTDPKVAGNDVELKKKVLNHIG